MRSLQKTEGIPEMAVQATPATARQEGFTPTTGIP